MMQSLLRELLPEDLDISAKIEATRNLLAQLPASNEFHIHQDIWANEISLQGYGDSGLYDLLLHSVDRCYDINEIFNFASTANLNIISFLGNASRFYEPKHSITDQALIDLISKKTIQERYSIGEKLSGRHIKHQFYLSRNKNCEASLDDENAIFLCNEMENQHEALHNAIKINEILSINYSIGNSEEVFQLKGNAINKACFKYMDGKTPIKNIIRKVKLKVKDTNEQKIKSELKKIFELMHPVNWIYLQKP